MGLTLVTPPTVWPVTLAEAKDQCGVRHSEHDTMIDRMIRAATSHVESMLEISLTTRTWRLTLDEFTDAIELPRGPVQSVTSVKYLDADGVEQMLLTDDYTTDLVSRSGWVVRNTDATWPTILDGINAVTVTYVAGFTALPADYEDLRHAILFLVGHFYNQRETVSDRQPFEVPLATNALVQPYRRIFV